jgi:exopolyphosphatase
LDTVNFSPTAKRATPKDVDIADQLQQLVPSDVSRDQLFTELQNAKENVSGLNTEQLLRKDVKILHNERNTVAVCSLPLLGRKLLKKYQNETEAVSKLSSFCASHDYAALVLVGIEIEQETSEIKRDVIVFSTSSSLKNTVIDYRIFC